MFKFQFFEIFLLKEMEKCQFHQQWCGHCKTMKKAVPRLINPLDFSASASCLLLPALSPLLVTSKRVSGRIALSALSPLLVTSVRVSGRIAVSHVFSEIQKQQHFEKASQAFAKDGPIHLVDIDCGQHTDFCSTQNIQGYPTVTLFTQGGGSESYSQARTFPAITGGLHPKLLVYEALSC